MNISIQQLSAIYPFHGDDIYLYDKNKHIKAVCLSSKIANDIAMTLNDAIIKHNEIDMQSEFMQSAICLCNAIEKAHIPVINIDSKVLEVAYHDFIRKFNAIKKEYKIHENKNRFCK